jgi:hypothetical protein
MWEKMVGQQFNRVNLNVLVFFFSCSNPNKAKQDKSDGMKKRKRNDGGSGVEQPAQNHTQLLKCRLKKKRLQTKKINFKKL